MMHYLEFIFWGYFIIGCMYGVFTFRSTANWLYEKYPSMDKVGYTKMQKFGYTFFKINALGFTAIIHIIVMGFLWSLDLFTKKRG